ncbi:hypothetical protein O0I10_006671 [Lichtheimia ornata]|uniref:F-box domain-containing protein n=1 Tax=Lichtheimia ornata TaxID=688661 RepID=A0AAD7Y0T2_9FUNG|nr:uncharacterized protein O0I10_006671 [Lichtheimia ornata]KAJ8657607.1 hypothetical protein O0I10_006671 [Lichtheimia ornata]
MQTRSSSNEPSSPNVNSAEREQPNVLALTTAIKKCVDFVNELPWEIVKCHLIPRIFGEGRPIVRLDRPYPCLDVCSTWTKRIVSADDSIHFVLHVDHPLSKHHRMRLRMVAPFIKSLALQDLGVYNPELVKCGQFLSLTKLNIEVTRCHEALLQLLEIAPNLTHLHMTFDDDTQASFAAFDVLDRCPQLIRLNLTLSPNTIIDMTSNSQRDRTYDNITHLQAVCQNEDRRDVFIPLIQHLPNLRLLYLLYPPSSTNMNTIHQHCPKIQQLFLSFTHVPYKIHGDIKQEEEDIPGLRLLSLHEGYYYNDYFPETMIQHSATLESLELKDSLLLYIPHVETFLGRDDVEFKQLKSLRFPDSSDPSFITFMEWVIEHAPNLESIDAIDLGAHTNVFNSTLRRRPLKRIGFRSTLEPQQHVYQFLRHHVRLGDKSHLQAVKCILHSISEHDSWIFLITELTQLKTLELRFKSNDALMGLDTFIHQVSEGCIGLEKVILKSTFFPSSSQWIHDLSKHRNLQEIIIDTTHIPDHLMIALQAFSHLKLLHLKYDIKDWHSLTSLRHKVPSLVYSEKHYPIL